MFTVPVLVGVRLYDAADELEDTEEWLELLFVACWYCNWLVL